MAVIVIIKVIFFFFYVNTRAANLTQSFTSLNNKNMNTINHVKMQENKIQVLFFYLKS